MTAATEPTIVLGYSDFIDRAAYEAAWAAPASGDYPLTTGDDAELDRCVQDAHREVVYSVAPYEWSWLRPQISIVLWKTATGVITGSGTEAGGDDPWCVNDAANTPFFPSMVGHTLVADTSENEYTIVDYVNSGKVQVDADASGDDADTLTITATGDYRLPANVRRIDSRMTYPAGAGRYQEVKLVSESHLRSFRQQSDPAGRPYYAALVPLNFDGVTVGGNPATDVYTGQRYDLATWKKANDDYTMTFMAYVMPDKLSTASPYPLGGAAMSHVYLAAVLAKVESRIDDRKTTHRQDEYEKALAAAVATDRKVGAALFHGRNLDIEDGDLSLTRHTLDVSLTVNGVQMGS